MEYMKVYVDQRVYIKVFNLELEVSSLSPLPSEVYWNRSYCFEHETMMVYVDQFCEK